MLALFWRSLRDRRTSIITYCLSAVLFVWMYVAIFPYTRNQAGQWMELIKNYPEGLFAAFGIREEQLVFDTLESFLALEHFSLIWPIMLLAMVIGWGGSAIAGEEERGTIEILLSQPVSRLKIFISKYLAGIAALIVFIVASIGSIPLLAMIYNLDYRAANYLSVAVLGFLFGLAVLSIAAFFSTIFAEKGRAYFISAGIFVLMYVMNVISALKENLSDLKFLSFFYYYDFNAALLDNSINPTAIWVFLGVAVIFTSLAAIWFTKKDVAI